MNIEPNKKDFESALDEMEELINKLTGILAPEHTSVLEAVVIEYTNHYVYDIEDLISENIDLRDQLG